MTRIRASKHRLRFDLMRIYLSHSTSYDFTNELYLPVRTSPVLSKHEWFLPHEKTDSQFASRELFRNGGCDLVVAEVSNPSLGVGIEMGWASATGIPVVAMHKTTAKPSQSVRAVASRGFSYQSIQDMVDKLERLIKEYEHA